MEKISEELILDQIKEIFNLGVGKASQEISLLVQEEVLLNVPYAMVITRQEAKKRVGISETSNITAIFHKFSGDVEGEAILIFQGERSLELVRFLLQEESSLEEMTELDEEAIGDVSSIIVNGVLTAMSKVLSIKLSSFLPYCIHGEFSSVLEQLFGSHLNHEDKLLYVTLRFKLKNKGIEGKLIFIQEMELAKRFFEYIENHLNKGLF